MDELHAYRGVAGFVSFSKRFVELNEASVLYL